MSRRDRKRSQRGRSQSGSPNPWGRHPEGGGSTPPPDPLDNASADVDQAEAAISGAGNVPREGEDEGIEIFPDELDDAGAERSSGRGNKAGQLIVTEEEERKGPRLIAFFGACRAELARVQWPNRQQVTQATTVVLGFVVIAGAYLGVLDYLASQFIDLII